MPVAVGADALVLIAAAIVALGGALLIRQVIISPMRGAATNVSGAPVIGGVLAWALSEAALLIEYAVQGLSTLEAKAKADGVNTLSWFVAEAWGWWFSAWYNPLQWVAQNFGLVYNAAVNLPAMLNTLNNVVQIRMQVIASDIANLQSWIDSYELPLIRGIGNDLAGLHSWIDHTLLGLVGGIGNDLAGLHSWIDNTLVPGIDARIRDLQGQVDRVNSDVQTRARSSDVDMLRQRVSDLESQLAKLAALAPLAALSTTAINELVETALDPCRCVDLTNIGDMEQRISALEVD